jgi:hypothetical protein
MLADLLFSIFEIKNANVGQKETRRVKNQQRGKRIKICYDCGI